MRGHILVSGDLIAFINARLAEDEHVARMAAEDASAGENWRVEARYPNSGSAGIVGEHGEKIVSDEGFPSQMEAAHIARHDPARALREVAVKRAILAEHFPIDPCDAHDGNFETIACDTLRLLGSTWGDHLDYSEDWAP